MSKCRVKAVGNYPRPGHTWTPGKTLCGLKAVESTPGETLPVTDCMRCKVLWLKAHWQHGIRWDELEYVKGVRQ